MTQPPEPELLFKWRYSSNVKKNGGDIIIPVGVASRVPRNVNVRFDDSELALWIDPRNRIRGTGSRAAITKWLEGVELYRGQEVPVYFDKSTSTLIFSSKDAD